jgi:hypothetical protein
MRAATSHSRSPILGDAPPRVVAAWDAYLETGGDPARYKTEPRSFERAGLELTCWQELRRTGLVVLPGGWLCGWGGHRQDRYFRIAPAARPLQPATDVELSHYFHHYGRNP